MSYTFTKLFSSITESTLWIEPHPTRIMWITMLAMADRQGRVFGSIPGLANRARVTLEEAETALRRFQEPDKYSRTYTEECEGRRIETIDGGWKLLNHAKYRALQDEETIKESKRNWWRENRGLEITRKTRTASIQAEAEADTDKPKNKVAALPDWLPKEAWEGFKEMRSKGKASLTSRGIKLLVSKLDELRLQGEDITKILDQSTANGWKSVYALKTGKSDGAWWSSEASTLAKGKELGLAPRGTESWENFRGRIREKIGD